MRELPDKVIAARDRWPEGIDAEVFASRLRESLSLTPEEKRGVVETLPGLTDGQILGINKFLEEDNKRQADFFLNHDGLLAALRQAVVEGHMTNGGDVDGARVAAQLLENELLSVYADLMRLEEEDSLFSIDELHALRNSIEKLGLDYAWNNLGIALGKQGDIDSAIEAFRKQIEIKPDHEWAWNNLGIALGKQGDIDDAIEAYRKQIEIKPDDEGAWNNLGIVLGKQGDIDGAIKAYRKQIEVKPDHAWAWNGLGIALAKQGDNDGAIAAYRKQIEVKPDHEWAWNGLGIALAKQGDIDGAIAAYRKQIEIKPNHQVAMNSLAWLYYEQQQNQDEAVALARKAVELDPKDLNARHTLATLLISVGNWEEARNHASAFLQQAETGWLESVWDDLLAFFREAVWHQHAAESAQLIEETGNIERLRPLHVALKAIAEGPDQLVRVAPEVRQPAEALIKQLSGSDVSVQ